MPDVPSKVLASLCEVTLFVTRLSHRRTSLIDNVRAEELAHISVIFERHSDHRLQVILENSLGIRV